MLCEAQRFLRGDVIQHNGKKIPVKQNNECKGKCVKLGTFYIKFCRKNSEDGAGEKENKAKKYSISGKQHCSSKACVTQSIYSLNHT